MKRGEIWLVALDPVRGQEIRKSRPAVVISQDAISSVSVRVVVPLTGWQAHFTGVLWIVRVERSAQSGLEKPSAANAIQIRYVSTERLTRKLGVVTAEELADIVAAVGIVIGHP